MQPQQTDSRPLTLVDLLGLEQAIVRQGRKRVINGRLNDDNLGNAVSCTGRSRGTTSRATCPRDGLIGKWACEWSRLSWD